MGVDLFQHLNSQELHNTMFRSGLIPTSQLQELHNIMFRS